jgi:hypothetical protein
MRLIKAAFMCGVNKTIVMPPWILTDWCSFLVVWLLLCRKKSRFYILSISLMLLQTFKFSEAAALKLARVPLQEISTTIFLASLNVSKTLCPTAIAILILYCNL